jgi:putative SOS response-associated peptidase YedK
MPGRFVRSSTNELLSTHFGIPFTLYPWGAPNFNIAPQTIQPIIRLNAKTRNRELAPARWGLVPSWAKDATIGLKTINARSEGIETKPSFSKALKERRCLIPADGYYEWQQISTKERQAFCIALKSREPIAFAGLWERALNPDGSPLETFTIITTSPNELVAPIHGRMGVILAPADYDKWLTANQPPLDLLRPFDAEEMQMWPVSDRVGNVRNNDPSLMEPVTLARRTLFD